MLLGGPGQTLQGECAAEKGTRVPYLNKTAVPANFWPLDLQKGKQLQSIALSLNLPLLLYPTANQKSPSKGSECWVRSLEIL